MRSKII